MANSVVREDLQYIINDKLIRWQELTGKTFLISGAAGFLPAYMVETLLYLNETHDLNIKIIALARNEKKAYERFVDYKNRDDLEFIIQDVCSPINIEGDIDYIIHAASQASPKYYGSDPVGTLSANVIGTSNLLKLAVEKKIKGFLYFSSAEIYGVISEENIPTNETVYGYVDPLDVRSCYAESKRMGETICISYLHQFGVPVKIVRPFHTYGPCMELTDGRVFADFVSNITNKQDIVMQSDGTAHRTFCYLSDATKGFFTVLLNGNVGEAYNIGSDTEISIRNLALMLVNLFPEKNLKVVQRKRNVDDCYISSAISRILPDITKAKQLGWSPEHSLEDGFKKTIRSFEI